jgi:hypothetical protein
MVRDAPHKIRASAVHPRIEQALPFKRDETMHEEGRVKFEGDPQYWIESPKNAKASAIDNIVWISFETTPRGESGRRLVQMQMHYKQAITLAAAILAAASEAEVHEAKNR